MPDPFSRRLALLPIALVVLGGSLRLWAWIAFPALDSYDRAPLVGAALGCAFFVACALWLAGRQPLLPRFVAVMIGVAVGAALGFGGFMVANGLFDQTPTTWLDYSVAGHWKGHRAIVTLTRSGSDGPATLWLPEDRSTLGTAIGTPVTVPMRPGALHVAWRPGSIRLGRSSDRAAATE